MLSVQTALIYTLVMGLAVFLCRAFPFIFLRKGKPGDGETRGKLNNFLSLVEKVVPPVAMTVLAVNSVSSPIKENLQAGLPAVIPVLAASLFTALVHIWKRNFLISVLGGTILYMVLSRVIF
jgi:branched-subunit amino acid transport protein AzlD